MQITESHMNREHNLIKATRYCTHGLFFFVFTDYPKGPPCIYTYFAVVTRSSEPHQNGSWEEKKPAMCMSYRGAEKFCIELIYEAGFLNSIKKGSF